MFQMMLIGLLKFGFKIMDLLVHAFHFITATFSLLIILHLLLLLKYFDL